MIRREILNKRTRLYLIAGIVGVISGITAVAFRFLILGISTVFFTIAQVFGIWGWVLVPVIGGFIVAFIVERYAPEARGHGVPEVLAAYGLEGGKIRARTPLLKGLASAICIGSGGSCGREGPIAQIGAGAGSALATLMHLGKKERKTLLVCGLSSGIAATFNAPLGGTLFGIEVIAGGIVGFSIIPIILSSVVATAVAGTILGPQVSFNAPLFIMNGFPELLLYLIMGIIFGIISVIWTRGFYSIEGLFERIKISKYILPAIGGLLTGLIAILVVSLEVQFGYFGVFSADQPYFPATMGVGYPFIDAALIGVVILPALVVFGILKMLATSATLGSGGSGGVFAPTLFIGTAFGAAFGLASSYLLPDIVAQPMAFALVGMAALFAGSGRAPITCIVIVIEMTRDYSMMLPLMMAVSASFLVASIIDDESIYSLKLAKRGIHIIQGVHISALEATNLVEVMTKDPTILSPTMTRTEVLEIIDATQHTKYPVIDSSGYVVGTLIAEVLFHDYEDIEPTVKDMMDTEFLHLTPGCKMDSVLLTMNSRDVGHAVVVDPMNPQVMIGFVTKADVLKAYELSIFRLQQRGYEIDEISPADIIDVD